MILGSIEQLADEEAARQAIATFVAPLGIKITIVEPGGFRTDFAGSSTELSETHPEYDSTVGATARFQRNYNRKQPGDTKKAAQAIVQLTQERNPPLRLLLGSDAYAAVEKNRPPDRAIGRIPSRERRLDARRKRAVFEPPRRALLESSRLDQTRNKIVGRGTLDEILHVRWKTQSDKKVKIKSKDEMRDDGIESPDVADAFMLTFAKTAFPNSQYVV
jgi:hypothetical protein